MTAQIGERLIYIGQEMEMSCCPELKKNHSRIIERDLNDPLEDGMTPATNPFLCTSACWREYEGTWQIRNNHFYLVGLQGRFQLIGDEPLFADWFTGEIVIKRGKLLKYVHVDFNSIFEIEIHIKIEDGLVMDKVVIDNRGKIFEPVSIIRRGKEIRKITDAIDRAQLGIRRYLEIMALFPIVDVSIDDNFQRKFNGFYRIRQRNREWYDLYYAFMEKNRNNPVLFEETLDYMKNALGRYEPSFSSKLAATINPNEPIWDSFVLQNTGQEAPPYSAKDKHYRAKSVFHNIRKWYSKYLQSDDGQRVIEIFNTKVKESDQITNIKKIDFVLWQTRL